MSQRLAIRKRSTTPQDQAGLPPWLVRGERLLLEAVRSVRLLGSVVPKNAAQERARLVATFEAGGVTTPRWSYVRSDHNALRKALARAAQRLEAEGHPVGLLYAERARELEIEAALASEAGTGVLGALARARFRSTNPAKAGEATILARKWIAEGHDAVASAPGDELIMSDAPVPGSLLTRMREEVSRLGLPFAVVVQPSLAALAATGERHILVAAGRGCTSDDVERTVMHEIEAHAIPRTRASRARLGIFHVGTARGIDDQEGFALVLEERMGYLGPKRKRELASRHLAVEAMDGGARFSDNVYALVREHGLTVRDAVLVAERAYRGGDGVTPGLGRERIYLEAFIRVGEHLARKATDEGILTSGQISLEAIDIVAPFVQRARATDPPEPPTVRRFP
ncbi:MAG TPA: tyrosine/phenylalanine carboxypeptidase domain-containing protein [Labilithrix sp.]|nr:tyrosine/phenylalanine carboxypeptidase domain-containing protein [Labilithrix sp.]